MRGSHFRDAVRAKGGTPRIVATGNLTAIAYNLKRTLNIVQQAG